jgi:hypothetical protein
MKIKKSMIMGLAVTALCGCLPEQTSDATDSIYSDVPVELTGVIGTGAGTRGYIIGGVINEVKNGDTLGLRICRANQEASGNYVYDNQMITGLLAVFDEGNAITMSPNQKYLANDGNSKFCAIYAVMSDISIEGGRYVIPIDLYYNTDVMVTDFVCGSRYNPVTDSQQLTFRHLFARYDLYVKAKEGNNIESVRKLFPYVNMDFHNIPRMFNLSTPLANDDDGWLLEVDPSSGRYIRTLNKSVTFTYAPEYLGSILLPPSIVSAMVVINGGNVVLENVRLADNPVAGKIHKIVFEFMDDGTIALGTRLLIEQWEDGEEEEKSFDVEKT